MMIIIFTIILFTSVSHNAKGGNYLPIDFSGQIGYSNFMERS